MWNSWDAEIVLIDTGSKIIEGFDVPEECARTEIFAELKEATRTEFYAAEAVKRRIDKVFEVNALDYNNEIYVEYEGKLYDVVRSYPVGRDKISLSCERRGPR